MSVRKATRERWKKGDIAYVFRGPGTGHEGEVVMLNGSELAVKGSTSRKGTLIVNKKDCVKRG